MPPFPGRLQSRPRGNGLPPGPAAGLGCGRREGVALDAENAALVARLKTGDESAFVALVELHHAGLVRLARAYVGSLAVAEEVAQETWLAALAGLVGFEGRASFRTWLFRILVNQAKTRGEREKRILPFSAVGTEDDEAGPGLDPDRFDARGHWTRAPGAWDPSVPEQAARDRELRTRVEEAVAGLPDKERAVVELRDLEEWTSQEVCNVLGISEVYQRVLLHRGRIKLRQALETFLEGRAKR